MIRSIPKKSLLALVICVLTACVFSSVVFSTRIQPHVDEVWSYMLSNKTDSPFLFTFRAGVGGESVDLDNFEMTEFQSYKDYFYHWHDGIYYRNALTVQPDERFDYGRVYYNQTTDVHPPLYYFLLHTICSFFPNQFSWWYAYSINLFFYAASLIVLYAICKKLGMRELTAVLAVFFWGFSLAGINMICYLRMYMMLAFLMMSAAYLHICLMQAFRIRYIAGIMLLDLAGLLTQYYAYVYLFFLTLFHVLYLFYKRRFKQGFLLGGAVLFCVGCAVMAFPAVLRHIFAGTYSDSVTYSSHNFLLRTLSYAGNALNIMMHSYFGFDSVSFFSDYVFPGLIVLLLAGCLIVKLLRLQKKENISQLTPENLRLIGKELKASAKRCFAALGKNEHKLIVLSFVCSAVVIQGISPDFGSFSERYHFLIMPLFSVLLLYYLDRLLSFLMKKRREIGKYRNLFLCLICASGIVMSLLFGMPSCFVQNTGGNDADFKQFYENSKMILVDDTFHAQSFAPDLMQTQAVYPAARLDEKLASVIEETDSPLYLAVSHAVYEKHEIDAYLSANGFGSVSFLGEYYCSTSTSQWHYFYQIGA